MSNVKMLREPKFSRSGHLVEIETMPETVYLNSRQAATYLNTTPQTLANWRSRRHGPTYEGKGRFIRYRVSALKAFMSSRANEVENT